MDAEQTQRVMEALDGALAVFRDAKGRRTAADIRVQSMISAARLVLGQRPDKPGDSGEIGP